MSTNDKPAILSAAEIDQYKATLADFDAAPPGSEEQGGIAYDCTVALRALLAHADALTRGAVDAMTLGRDGWSVYRREHNYLGSGWIAWDDLGGNGREAFAAAAVHLFTLGRAAGRSEREAECASLLQQHRIDRDALNGTESELDGARAEIARLTAGNVDEASRVALGRELIGADRPIPCPKCGKPVRLPDEATDGELSVGECLTCEEDVDVEATVVVAWSVA